MKTRFIIASSIVVVGALIAYAASSSSFTVHPDEFDNGGGYSSSTSFQLNCSIGGSVIAGEAGGASFTNSSSFLPMLETRSATAAPDLQVSAGPNNPSDSNEAPGATVPMLQVTLTAGQSTNVVISALTVNPSGSGPDHTDVASISLYLDANGDGAAGAGETLIATLANPFPADDAAATVNFMRTLPSGSSETWLLVYTFGSGASGTFQASVSPSDFGAAGSIGEPVVVSGNPVFSGVKSIGMGGAGTLKLSVGPANRAAGNRFAPGQEGPVLQIRLEASSLEDIRVTGLRLTATGTANDPADIDSLTLYLDSNGDGLVEASQTPLVTVPMPFPTDNGRASLSFPAQVAPASGAFLLLVVARISPSSQGAQTFGLSLAQASHVTAEGANSGLAPSVTGAPIGSMISIEPAAAPVTPQASAGGSCGRSPGESGSPLAALLLGLAAFAILRLARRGPALE